MPLSAGSSPATIWRSAAADDPRAYAYTAAEYSSRLFQIEGAR